MEIAQAEAEAEASRIRAMAAKIHHEVEAEGLTLMNTAANLLTPEARQSALRRQLIDKLEGSSASWSTPWSASRSACCTSRGWAAAAGRAG